VNSCCKLIQKFCTAVRFSTVLKLGSKSSAQRFYVLLWDDLTVRLVRSHCYHCDLSLKLTSDGAMHCVIEKSHLLTVLMTSSCLRRTLGNPELTLPVTMFSNKLTLQKFSVSKLCLNLDRS